MKCITLKNKYSTEVTLSSLGASILDIKTLDYKNELGSIVIVPKDKEKFYTSTSYFGKTIGRTGGRITNGKFALNGKQYQIISNDKNGLHGGNDGLSYKDFDTFESENNEAYLCEFKYFSKDLESGYPGNLNVSVLYKLYKNQNKLDIVYNGECDQDTLLNLSNHSYFNLSGNAKSSVLGQKLVINSDYIGEVDEYLIPTGKNIEVKNTPFDFNNIKEVGKDINEENIQLKYGSGYDHPWILNKKKENDVMFYHKESGRCLEIKTNQKAIVCYSMNFTDDLIMECGRVGKKHDAICFEAQSLPVGYDDCFINDIILRNGEVYDNETIYKFYIK